MTADIHGAVFPALPTMMLAWSVLVDAAGHRGRSFHRLAALDATGAEVRHMPKAIVWIVVGLAAIAGAGLVMAQDAVVRTPLQKSDVPGADHTTHLLLITVAPGATVAPHTHPGIEMGYVMEGEGLFSLAGEPDRVVRPGDTYLVPAGAVHSARNTGAVPIRIVGSFVVDKGKPLASPAR